MSKQNWIIVTVALVVTVVASVLLIVGNQKTAKEHASGNIVSDKPIHWHPQLAIFINGRQVKIPANLGIGKKYQSNRWFDPMMGMTDIHTHDSSGTLHWEVMQDKTPVTKDHVQLSNFFEIWGQPFNSTTILGYEGTVKMTVNGKPNSEFGKYLVKDKDQIVLRYEK